MNVSDAVAERKRDRGQGGHVLARAALHCATGKPLSHEPLVGYLKDKLYPLYGLDQSPV